MASSPPFAWLELRRNAHIAAADTRHLQNRRLQRIVRHSYRWVPFYRRHLKTAGLTPHDIRSVDDLEKIPILRRADFQNIDPAGRLDRSSNIWYARYSAR